MSENHRLEVFSNWERQFRRLDTDGSFWRMFISTITCGSGKVYEEDCVMRLVADFRSRSPLNLPVLTKSVLAGMLLAPLVIATQTTSGIVERILLYWCFPVVALSSMWYWTFQLTPNFRFQNGWEKNGVEEGFLNEDFNHMELRRMARLRSGSLALVPEAAYVGDQIWSVDGGVVPLVLRPKGDDFELVGECYSAMTRGLVGLVSSERTIRLV